MPKIHSPFIRKTIDGRYVCTPEIDPEYKWVFEDSIAVDKLHGTNVSVRIQNGRISEIMNRENTIDYRFNLFSNQNIRFVEGVMKALQKQYIRPKYMKDGRYFGELIGEKFHLNPYKIAGHLWIPFEKLLQDYEFRFWQDVLPELKDKSDKEIFEKVSEIFQKLWSVYKRNRKIQGPEGQNIDRNTVFDKTMAAEGIVFYNRDMTKMAKLRRDMFDWYKGDAHQPNIKLQ